VSFAFLKIFEMIGIESNFQADGRIGGR